MPGLIGCSGCKWKDRALEGCGSLGGDRSKRNGRRWEKWRRAAGQRGGKLFRRPVVQALTSEQGRENLACSPREGLVDGSLCSCARTGRDQDGTRRGEGGYKEGTGGDDWMQSLRAKCSPSSPLLLHFTAASLFTYNPLLRQSCTVADLLSLHILLHGLLSLVPEGLVERTEREEGRGGGRGEARRGGDQVAGEGDGSRGGRKEMLRSRPLACLVLFFSLYLSQSHPSHRKSLTSTPLELSYVISLQQSRHS
eukprot:749032-Hanusia_phi.AAC.5